MLGGSCVVEWKDTKDGRPKKFSPRHHNDFPSDSKTLFRGEEVFIHFTKEVFGSNVEHQPKLSEVGNHSFPFTYQLPLNLPYSVESEFAIIRFWIKAKLIIAWGSDLDHLIPFNVIHKDDLNLFPELKKPIEIEKITNLSAYSCYKKPLNITVKLDKTGFACGENVRVTIEYQNKTNIQVINTLIELLKYEKLIYQKAVFRASRCVPLEKGYKQHSPHDFSLRRVNNYSLVKSTTVASEKAEGVGSNKIARIVHYLKIPEDIQASNERFSRIYRIYYYLKVTAVIRGMLKSPKILKIPITIGNVAITDSV